MEDGLLTFEWDAEKETLEIHVDQEGAKKLISYLEPLVDATGQAHFHLKTPAWAGNELSEEQQGEKNKLIHHVQLMFWPE